MRRVDAFLWSAGQMSYKVGAKLFIKKGGKKTERKREYKSICSHCCIPLFPVVGFERGLYG